MRILFILENYYPNIGGVETLFKNLTESLVAQDYEVTVLTNKYSRKLKSEELIDGVKIIRLPFFNRYLFTLFGFFPALKYARQNDIIHTTSYNAGIPAFMAGFLTRTKTIITFHEVWGKLWFSLPFMNKFFLGLHYLFERVLLTLPFNKFVAVSNYTAQSLEKAGVSRSKIQVILNGIQYNEYKKRQDHVQNSPYTFLYFGRLGISKGLDILLKSAKLLSKEIVDFKVILVIPSIPANFNNKIKSIIEEYNLGEYIDIKSDLLKDELKEEIHKSDSVVIPSYSEGFCFSAAECVALGVPIISSAKGALTEVVSGRHIHSKQLTATAIKDCMVKAINNNWDYSELKFFHLEKTIERYIKLYKSIHE